MTNFSISYKGAKETAKALQEADRNAIKLLRNKLKTELLPEANSIVSEIPAVAPIKGMARTNGRTRWLQPKATIAFTPGSVRGFRGAQFSPLVTIKVQSPKDAVGFEMAELAGIRRHPPRRRSKIPNSSSYGKERGDGSYLNNGQGDNFIAALERAKPIKGRAGRFAFDIFIRKRKVMETKAANILDNYFKKTLERIVK